VVFITCWQRAFDGWRFSCRREKSQRGYISLHICLHATEAPNLVYIPTRLHHIYAATMGRACWLASWAFASCATMYAYVYAVHILQSRRYDRASTPHMSSRVRPYTDIHQCTRYTVSYISIYGARLQSLFACHPTLNRARAHPCHALLSIPLMIALLASIDQQQAGTN